jgi:hypothetical protein
MDIASQGMHCREANQLSVLGHVIASCLYGRYRYHTRTMN